jgi:signal transduction histidine kinase/ActR/RegA family two-component response regulator
MEYRIIRPDGRVRWIFGRGRVIRGDDGKPVRYAGVDMDVTERKEAEAALAESRERLRLAQEATGIGTWDWDIVTGAMAWSPSQWRLHQLAERPGGPTREEWRRTIHPEDRDRASAALGDAIVDRAPYETEYRVVLADGSVRWLAARGTVIADEAGRPARIVGITFDATQQRAAAELLEQLNRDLERRVAERTAQLEAEAARRVEAEARLFQAQKMESVGQLTGGIAHDFNNLLTVIVGNLDTIRRRLKQPADGETVAPARLLTPVEMAMQGAMHASQLTNRLLAFSRQQALEPKILDVNQLVSGLSEMIGRTLGETIEVETILSPALWPTFADVSQLETSLLNLVVNARDAMPRGGKLVMRTANVEVDAASGTRAELTPGDYVLLCVCDTGIGIAPEVLDRVYEPFFTTKETGKGSGLGLSMVHGFVTQSGGHIRISSEIARGTTVALYLPRLMETVHAGAKWRPRQGAETMPLPRARPDETILVVEDNEDVRQYAVSVMAELGYEVLQAADGPSALRLLDTTPAFAIDLLFTDIVLPGGMSGRSLAEEALRLRPDLAVLFTTGYSRDAELHRTGLGANMHLITKPYNLDGLAAKIRAALDARPTVEETRRPGGKIIPFREA